MELNSLNFDQSITFQVHDGVKCGICHSNLGKNARIYQEGLNFGVVCKKCYNSNSLKDLELMANIFMAYGGYFGKLQDPNYSLYRVLKSLISENDVNNSFSELNIKILYEALLHGIGPSQFRQSWSIMKKL